MHFFLLANWARSAWASLLFFCMISGPARAGPDYFFFASLLSRLGLRVPPGYFIFFCENVYMYWARFALGQAKKGNVDIEKSNILPLGPKNDNTFWKENLVC